MTDHTQAWIEKRREMVQQETLAKAEQKKLDAAFGFRNMANNNTNMAAYVPQLPSRLNYNEDFDISRISLGDDDFKSRQKAAMAAAKVAKEAKQYEEDFAKTEIELEILVHTVYPKISERPLHSGYWTVGVYYTINASVETVESTSCVKEMPTQRVKEERSRRGLSPYPQYRRLLWKKGIVGPGRPQGESHLKKLPIRLYSKLKLLKSTSKSKKKPGNTELLLQVYLAQENLGQNHQRRLNRSI